MTRFLFKFFSIKTLSIFLLISTYACYKNRLSCGTFAQTFTISRRTDSIPDSSGFNEIKFNFTINQNILNAQNRILSTPANHQYKINLNNSILIDYNIFNGYKNYILGRNVLKKDNEIIITSFQNKRDSLTEKIYFPPLKVTGWNNAHVRSCDIKTQKLNGDIATINACFKILVDTKGDYIFRIANEKKDTFLFQGLHNVFIDFKIISPKIWWCIGEGKQNSYKLFAQVFSAEKIVSDTILFHPIRSLNLDELYRNPGNKYFYLNGKKVLKKSTTINLKQNQTTDYRLYKIKKIVPMLKTNGTNILYYNEKEIAVYKDYFERICEQNGIIPIPILMRDF